MKEKKHKGHLTLEERELIANLHFAGKSLNDIKKVTGRDRSVISRELKRNKHPKKKIYSPSIAQKLYNQRRSHIKKRKRLKNSKIRFYTVNKLKEGWSPEEISGRIKIDLPGYSISHEAIYQFIYDERIQRFLNLIQHLRRKHKKRFKKGLGRKAKRSNIPRRIPIEQRPQEANERTRIGDLEGDSIVSRKSNVALTTLVDRKSGYLFIGKVERKTAENTKNEIIDKLNMLPKQLRHTLTLDNGCEFTKHEEITRETGVQCFFANPYHSWERGTNENTNGLIREYFPKGTDFNKTTREEINIVENNINDRPRKRLKYRTPREVLMEELNKVA